MGFHSRKVLQFIFVTFLKKLRDIAGQGYVFYFLWGDRMDNIVPLIDEESIAKRIDELANQISNDYKNEELTVICILKGATIFTCDLIRKLSIPVYLDFMVVSSYVDTESTGSVKIIKDLDHTISNKNVLIIDDIIDTGMTLQHLVNTLKVRNPKSIKLCTLLDKPARRVNNLKVDYYGFKIKNEFVVGYGLDYNQKYRNLSFIGKF